MQRLRGIAEDIMERWTSQDVDRVLEAYTQDLVYLDPNTRGPVLGREAMRSYLTKLFSQWIMSWKASEIFPLDGIDGVAIRWTATLSPAGDARAVEIGGIDLAIMEGDLLKRNEVYFDRAPLAALLAPASA